MHMFRILVVDDYSLFRVFISNLLSDHPQFQIVGEAEDGAMAVQMAAALQPDIVTLDVSMPTLNGFEAAKIIRRVSPSTQILFVSSECSTEFVEEAVRCGASGYVDKCQLFTELLPVMHALVEDGHELVFPDAVN